MSLTSQKRFELLNRRRQVSRWHLKGLSQDEIAARLGVNQATISRDVKAINAQWSKEIRRNVNFDRRAELAQIDLIACAAWQSFLDSHQPVRTAQIVRDPETGKEKHTSKVVEKGGGDVRCLMALLKCRDARRDALEKQEAEAERARERAQRRGEETPEERRAREELEAQRMEEWHQLRRAALEADRAYVARKVAERKAKEAAAVEGRIQNEECRMPTNDPTPFSRDAERSASPQSEISSSAGGLAAQVDQSSEPRAADDRATANSPTPFNRDAERSALPESETSRPAGGVILLGDQTRSRQSPESRSTEDRNTESSPTPFSRDAERSVSTEARIRHPAGDLVWPVDQSLSNPPPVDQSTSHQSPSSTPKAPCPLFIEIMGHEPRTPLQRYRAAHFECLDVINKECLLREEAERQLGKNWRGKPTRPKGSEDALHGMHLESPLF